LLHEFEGAGARYPQEESVDGKKVLERLSRETGAHMYEVSKKESIEEIHARIGPSCPHQHVKLRVEFAFE
jgi:hypothetical protein